MSMEQHPKNMQHAPYGYSIEDALKIASLTQDFYAKNSGSFSETRTRPWDGWKHLAAILKEKGFFSNSQDTSTVLDLGCGNMRFEHFLTQQSIDATFEFFCVDSCDDLSLRHSYPIDRIHYQDLDITAALANDSLSERIRAPKCKLSVAFGLMHHIPVFEWRKDLLRSLIDHTEETGIICVSFWQFFNSEKLRKKAKIATEAATSRHGIHLQSKDDAFLSWKDDTDTFRFCHNFTNEEIRSLIDSVYPEALLIDSYQADNSLNSYIVLERSASKTASNMHAPR